ncbi:MAG: ABC transporter ATP-binding protein, partial [Ignavibacteriae bacterium]
MVALNDVSFKLEGNQILENISMQVNEGGTEIILGPSGAGKSSILKVILRLWKPQNGQVIINGEDITNYSERQLLRIRRKMGIVFQGNALFDSLTVAENAAYFLKEQGIKDEQLISEQVDKTLSFINMDGTNNLYPSQLSGGMKKRVAIARAIAFEPQLLLLDEPTGGLDPINAKAIDELIKKINTQGTTVIVVTHFVHEAIFLADKLTIMNEGRIIESNSVRQLLNSKNELIQNFFYGYNYELNIKNKY